MVCETVGKYRIVDREMFALIEKLATRDHKELIGRLPDTVRDNQRERALAVQSTVRKRLG